MYIYIYIHFIIQQSDFNIRFVYLLSFTPVGIVCSAVGRSEVEITCEGIEPSVLLQCSFSGGPLHPCEMIIILYICTICKLGTHSLLGVWCVL